MTHQGLESEMQSKEIPCVMSWYNNAVLSLVRGLAASPQSKELETLLKRPSLGLEVERRAQSCVATMSMLKYGFVEPHNSPSELHHPPHGQSSIPGEG
jgi:hypothetical protein